MGAAAVAVLRVPRVLQLSQMPLMQGEAERSHEGAGFGVPALISRLGAGRGLGWCFLL